MNNLLKYIWNQWKFETLRVWQFETLDLNPFLDNYFSWHTGKAGLWTHGLDPWLWTPGHLDSRHVDSGLLDAWTLDNWSNELWPRGLWALGLWIIRTKKLFQFFVIFLSFLNISNTLRLVTYVLLKVLRVIVIILTCYNWNLWITDTCGS